MFVRQNDDKKYFEGIDKFKNKPAKGDDHINIINLYSVIYFFVLIF